MADLRGCKLGEFVLRERIGSDDLGDVYRGEQLQLGRDVVVKVLYRRYDDETLQRYMHEARLDHPHAVHIYDFGVDQNGSAWIAMELTRGVMLKQG
jgi:serine/threonine protein kinase